MYKNEMLIIKKTWYQGNRFSKNKYFLMSIFANIIFFGNVPGILLICFRYPGVSKDKNNWFWGLVTGSKIQKS